MDSNGTLLAGAISKLAADLTSFGSKLDRTEPLWKIITDIAAQFEQLCAQALPEDLADLAENINEINESFKNQLKELIKKPSQTGTTEKIKVNHIFYTLNVEQININKLG